MNRMGMIVVLIIGLSLGVFMDRLLGMSSEETVQVVPTETGSETKVSAQPVRWKLASAYAGSAQLLGTLGHRLVQNLNQIPQYKNLLLTTLHYQERFHSLPRTRCTCTISQCYLKIRTS